MKKNLGFLIPSFIFFLTLAIISLLTDKGECISYFSDNRNGFIDTFFKYGTYLGEEPVYAILTILGLFFSFKFAIKVPLVGFSIMGISALLKNIFQQPRPWTYYLQKGELENFNFVEGVHVLSGLSSFPSGHTMSGFGLFYLLSLHFPKKNILGIICFIFAFIIGFSRNVLFQHFIEDILFGGIVGILVSQLIDYLFSKINASPDYWINKNILNFSTRTKSV